MGVIRAALALFCAKVSLEFEDKSQERGTFRRAVEEERQVAQEPPTSITGGLGQKLDFWEVCQGFIVGLGDGSTYPLSSCALSSPWLTLSFGYLERIFSKLKELGLLCG